MENDVRKRRSGKRQKKRHFHGNQFKNKMELTSNNGNKDESVEIRTPISSIPNVNKSISASKRKLNLENEEFENTDFRGNIIIDKRLFFSFLEENVVCKVCNGKLKIDDKRIIGLSTSISIECEECHRYVSTRNSKLIGVKKNIPEINRRIVYAMRCIGQGLEPLKTFCGIMDFYSPITQKPYDKICENIRLASKSIAVNSMKKAAKEEINLNNSTDITVSGDGTWKTRGHSSQIGVCVVIGALTGKVIDAEVLSLSCKGCEAYKGPYSGADFQKWNDNHAPLCLKNHSGSSGKMECDGMVTIFQRSQSERGVRYTNYIGDGDSKTFLSISESKPYGDTAVTKLECVGHIQKRMGTRLRNLKKEIGSKKLSDGKGLSGKGRLTDKIINQLSTYYGNAIRQHCNSVKEMRNAVWAVYFHTRSTDSEPLHSFCPKDASSWCKYQKSVINGDADKFRHKKTLPSCVMDAIKPVFNALSQPTLLSRCLGAFTQNANESFNSIIWQICPKMSGSGRKISEIAVSEAVILFNEGRKGRLSVMKKLGIEIGGYAAKAQIQADKKRVDIAEKRALSNTLEARRAKRRQKIANNSLTVKKEGCVYQPGGF